MKFEKATRSEVGAQHDDERKPESEHHSIYCPNCSHRLTGHRCKLICQRCGYYLSCADYY